MSKDKISDYSATANSNTDIGGINIDEGCAPSGINDAIRTLMKQLKDWQSGSQDVYIHPAGSASVPSITATGDTNTGLFFPAADTVGITTGGTERARIDSSGNLGLGVTPSAWGSIFKAVQGSGGGALAFRTDAANLDLLSDAYYNGTNFIYQKTGYNAGRYRISDDSLTHAWYTAPTGTAGGTITFTQAMTLDASGNLGVGTTSPADTLGFGRALDIQSTAGGSVYLRDSDATSEYLSVAYEGGTSKSAILYNSAAGPMKFYTSATERARIDSSGNLLVGTTSSSGSGASSGKIVSSFNGAVANGLYCDDTRTSAGTDNAINFGRGSTLVGRLDTTLTSLALTNLSDQRVKTNIQDSGSAITLVGSVKVRQFDWTIDQSHEDFGFVAQELNEVLPQAVSVGKTEEEMWGVNFVKLVPILTKAIQEQQAIITQLQADVAALKG